jgi:hypothetical protein
MPEIEADIGYHPRSWQVECHTGLKRFSVLVCHRRAGKTVMAGVTLLDAAGITQKSMARYVYLAPFLKQAKAVAWGPYLKPQLQKIPGVKINESELWGELPNGARISVYGADNPDALRGLYIDGIVIDEVADMKPEVWGQIIRPALADRNGWALFIGTPKGPNLFSEVYQKARKDPDWYTRLYTYRDTGCISPEEIELMRKTMTENQFRQEMLCDFDASSDNQLITIDIAHSAAGKHIPESEYEYAPRVMGVDVARYGGDRSVIFARQGLVSHAPKIYTIIDNMALAAKVAEHWVEWKPDAVFIDAGRGEGVIDRLRQLGFSPIPVDFGGRPNKPTFVNKRAEMWWEMADWLRSGASTPDITELKIDLCGPTYSYANAAGKLELESKDQLRKRGMASPDLADALALTFAHPVAVTRGPGSLITHHTAKAATEYDPYE